MSKVIIWTNLVVLERPMLYTKFQLHRFWKVLPYCMAAILVMWLQPFEQTFFPSSLEAPYEILL